MTYIVTPEELEETRERIQQKHVAEDIPCIMSFAGCDYDAACDAVFNRRTDEALALLDAAQAVTH